MTIYKALLISFIYLVVCIAYADTGITVGIGKFPTVSGMEDTTFKGSIYFKEKNNVFFVEHISVIENRHDKGINSINYKYVFTYKNIHPYLSVGVRDSNIDDIEFYGNSFSTILTRIGIDYKYLNIEILDKKPFIGIFYSF